MNWNTRKHTIIGALAVLVLIGGVGAWSVMTRIAGAIVANGLVEVEVNRQVVQHPDGGVIGEILIDDGDTVEAGDILMRFDDTLLRSDQSVIRGQLYEISARKSRLQAERDGADTITFDSLLTDASDPLAQELMDGQQDLFVARHETIAREESLLQEKIQQIGEQIVGSDAQLAAFQSQKTLIEDELVDEQGLLDQGLSQASKVRSLQRESARLDGQIGELKATIAENKGRIAEIEIEVLRLGTNLREEAITTLRDLQFRQIELSESLRSIDETLQRLDVRAPASGIIFGKQFHTVRSVVRPADPILYIVPQDADLIITTKILSVHIDQVHVGQPASLQFTAFDMRTTPEISGTVTNVSPDVFTDDVTGESYYSAEILPDDTELEKLEGLDIVPGMPVQAFLKTADRTPLEYLLKPLTDYFNRAFRES